MLGHLAVVLNRDLRLTLKEASDFVALAESYSIDGPSLTLGGVGVLPIHDAEDRHVLETAWSGGADILTTADVRGFVAPDAENLVPGRVWRLRRADRILILAHPFETAAWLRGEEAFGVGER
jgi:predicted nucleic acid-binding protein